MSADLDARVWGFPPGPKISRLFPRVLTAEETRARVLACLARIPVTRLADLTGLDPLGLPVWSAVTPLARDLTTHMGKGADSAAAQASALMEAVERVCAESVPGPRRQASAHQLAGEGLNLLDPRECDLPADSAYAPDRPLDWTMGWDLLAQRSIWLPVDLVVSPPSQGVLTDVDTNGLAAGNTLLEAVVHGLGEVIERDASSQQLFGAMFGGQPSSARVLDPASLPAALTPWTCQIASEGLSLVLADITSDIGVATFKALLLDHAFPGAQGPEPRLFLGFGCDPCAEVALRRALTEAVQSRMGVIQAARDSFNSVPMGSNPATWRAAMRELEPGEAVSFASVPSAENLDLRDDLQHLLAQLRGSGFKRAVAVDLTRADLGIPVVRVRVPGLASFLGNRRRIGWRCLRHLL